MEVVVHIPDKFFGVAENGANLSRRVLEAYAIEEYRQENLSLGQVSEFLNLSLDETHALLKKHRVPRNYSWEDLAEDRRAIEALLKK